MFIFLVILTSKLFMGNGTDVLLETTFLQLESRGKLRRPFPSRGRGFLVIGISAFHTVSFSQNISGRPVDLLAVLSIQNAANRHVKRMEPAVLLTQMNREPVTGNGFPH